MIIKKLYKTREDNVKLFKTYSSDNYKILQVETGIIYEEAIDLETSNYAYEETEELIEQEETDETDETKLKAQAYDILIGEVE